MLEGPGDERDPSLTQTRDGTQLRTYITFLGRAKVPVSFTVALIRSDDLGKSRPSIGMSSVPFFSGRIGLPVSVLVLILATLWF